MSTCSNVSTVGPQDSRHVLTLSILLLVQNVSPLPHLILGGFVLASPCVGVSRAKPVLPLGWASKAECDVLREKPHAYLLFERSRAISF